MPTLYTRSMGHALAMLTAVVVAPGVTLLRAIVTRTR